MNKLYTKPIADEYIKLFNIKENTYIQTSNLNKFSEYPKILVYNTQNDEVLGEVSTTNPLICLHELFILTDDLKSQGFIIDIAVFDNKKYKLIKDIEILKLIRQLINNENK